MKKLFVFLGDGGSGKTTLISELVRRHPDMFRKVVTCTSRPMRSGEIDGEDYYFLPQEYFVDNKDLVLAKKTDDGYYYGTRRADLFPSSHHLLLTSKPTGVRKLLDLGCRNITAVCIAISEKLKIERMRQRGDSEEMIADRLRADAAIRSEGGLMDIPIIRLQAIQSIEEEVASVLRAC